VLSYRYGCVALLAEGEARRAFVGRLPDLDIVSPLGWTDALIAGYAVHLLEGHSPVECLRFGLGCGAANLMTWGAGVFSPADAERYAQLLEIEEVSTEA
jgi:fructose-1-phosphate kinase PfkB-like protein